MKRKRFLSVGAVLLLLAVMIKTTEYTPVMDKAEHPKNAVSEEAKTKREISTDQNRLEGVVYTLWPGVIYTLWPGLIVGHGVELEKRADAIYRLKDGKADIIVSHALKGREYLVDERGERLAYNNGEIEEIGLSNLVYDQGYLYYVLMQSLDRTGNGQEYYSICRVPEDGGAVEKLADCTGFYNLYNDKIYYVIDQGMSGEFVYYEMELDGSEKKILEDEWEVKEDNPQDQGRNLWGQISTTAGEGAVYTLQPRVLEAYGVNLEKIEDASIYRLKDGKADIIVSHALKGEKYLVDEREYNKGEIKETGLSNLAYHQGYLYYVLLQNLVHLGSGRKYYSICRVPADGGAFEKLADCTGFFNLYNDKIYYTEKIRGEKEYTYYEMELDGSGKRIIHGTGNGELILGGGILFSFSEDGIIGVNLETGKLKFYEFPGEMYDAYYEDGILYIMGHIDDGETLDQIWCLNVKTGEKTLFKKSYYKGLTIIDGYMYEFFDEKILENGKQQAGIKIINLKTRDSVQHVLGDFDRVVPRKAEKVGDDIVLEIYIYEDNDWYCYYKQNIDKVWEEGFPEQWEVKSKE